MMVQIHGTGCRENFQKTALLMKIQFFKKGLLGEIPDLSVL